MVNYKPIKHKKDKGQRNSNGFWSKWFRRKEKAVYLPEASVSFELPRTQNKTRKRNGTELILPEDKNSMVTTTTEPDIVAGVFPKIVQLTISVNGMTSEVEITSFPCTLGRTPDDANVILRDSGVSRQHAVIDFDDGGFIIYDVGSRNGSALNDTKLAPNVKHLITSGDRIKIGRVDITVTNIEGV